MDLIKLNTSVCPRNSIILFGFFALFKPITHCKLTKVKLLEMQYSLRRYKKKGN